MQVLSEVIRPDPRSRRHQRYCSATACRAASKAASQARWLATPENQGYFRGPVNVARVQAWRSRHPGYWRKGRRVGTALQDLSMAQFQPLRRPWFGVCPEPIPLSGRRDRFDNDFSAVRLITASSRLCPGTAPRDVSVTSSQITPARPHAGCRRSRISKLLPTRCKRGKTGGGMILRFSGRHELDLFWEWCRLPTSMAYRTPI